MIPKFTLLEKNLIISTSNSNKLKINAAIKFMPWQYPISEFLLEYICKIFVKSSDLNKIASVRKTSTFI